MQTYSLENPVWHLETARQKAFKKDVNKACKILGYRNFDELFWLMNNSGTIFKFLPKGTKVQLCFFCEPKGLGYSSYKSLHKTLSELFESVIFKEGYIILTY